MRSGNLVREDFDSGPPSMDCVEDGLWIGNLSAALDVMLQRNHINYILTADSCPLPNNITFMPDLKIKFVQITDLPYEDLLSHFDETYEFIQTGQNNGSVLVHCYFGVSRSAAIVVAFLMKKYSLSYGDALERLKEKRKLVGPNNGFENQLRLYETLKYTLREDNLQYKMFRLRVTANKVAKVKIVPQDCQQVIKSDPSLITVKPDPRVYRCKKCRRILVCANNLLPHVRGEKSSWKDVKWSEDYGHLNICSDMYFIEPMFWIKSVLQSESGKILCPKCNFKLGSFSWTAGSQCSCGAKVSPSFYLIPSRVDFSNIVQNLQLTV